MKKILILAGRYLPGYKDGGPVRTLINLTNLLGDEYDFRIAVLDRDHGDKERYPNIKINEWNQVGKAKVWYYSSRGMKFSLIRKLAKNVDLVYICGFYNGYGYKTLLLKRFGMLFGKPVVVASMGSFSKGALLQKSMKKKIFINLCNFLGLFNGICWSVTSNFEENDVKREIGENVQCVIAEDPPRNIIKGHNGSLSDVGKIKIGFVARICRHKNLMYLISVLELLTINIDLTIGGVIEEQDYWNECQNALKKLPKNINWNYAGELDSERILDFFAEQDALVLPTLSENYCHVVFEALSAGCIPVISDRTPWNWIQEYGCGYVLSLEDKQGFVNAIKEIAYMNSEQKNLVSNIAIKAANLKLQQTKEHTGYRNIFSRE